MRADRRPAVNLMTSDEYPAYAAAIPEVYGDPEAGLPDWLVYATVHKVRERNRVVKVEARVVFGTLLILAAAPLWSVVVA